MKGNTNTFSAPKQQSNSSSPSNSDLKTNVLSSDKSKAVKTTSKALSTRCFKCHRVGHYANKCQKQKSLVTLEKIETEPENEDPLPIFDDYAHEPKEGSGGEQNCGHREGSSSIHKPDQTQGEQRSDYGSFAYNPFPFNVSDLRTNLFEEEGNDVPQSADHYMEPAQHGVQDVLNISTEVHVFHRTRLDLDHARIEKDHARLDLDHEFMHFDQSNLTKARILHLSEDIGHTWSSMVHDLDMVVHTDSPTSVVLLTAVHASGYNESGQKPNNRGYIKSHSASLDDPFNPSQFQKCRLPSQIISNTQLK
ncbi:hypothetical protein YC2023_018009 [Brassica napus]